MKTRMFVTLVTLCSTVVLMTGCGGGGDTTEPGGEASPETSNTSAITPPSAEADQHRLIGTWLGVAYLEDAKLKAKLDQTIDPTAKQNLISQAQTFQSMLVGAEFQPDGNFTLDAEITPFGGQPARDQTAGQWEISSEVDEMVMVKGVESRADGTQEESFKQYTFVDEDHFVWIPSVSPDLQECDAMVVFERQPKPTEVRNAARVRHSKAVGREPSARCDKLRQAVSLKRLPVFLHPPARSDAMGLNGINRSNDKQFTPKIINGRWQSVVRPGSKNVKRSTYRGWEIEIIDRSLGMTLKRATFAAVAKGPQSPFHFYRGFLPSEKLAVQAIHRIVDNWHNENAYLLNEENVQQLRRKRMAKKLFKIRNKMAAKRAQAK